MAYRDRAADALSDWRDAERRLADFEPESEPWRMAYLEAQLAKGRYQEAVDEARGEQLPEPPPFEEATADVDVAVNVERTLSYLE